MLRFVTGTISPGSNINQKNICLEKCFTRWNFRRNMIFPRLTRCVGQHNKTKISSEGYVLLANLFPSEPYMSGHLADIRWLWPPCCETTLTLNTNSVGSDTTPFTTAFLAKSSLDSCPSSPFNLWIFSRGPCSRQKGMRERIAGLLLRGIT